MCGLSLVVVSRGYFLVAGLGLLTEAAALLAEDRLQSVWASVVMAHGLCPTAGGVFPDQGSDPCPLH